MQKFNACKKRDWLIHFFFSTSSVCMIAICPVGPPKEINPSLSQKRNASPKLVDPLTVVFEFRVAGSEGEMKYVFHADIEITSAGIIATHEDCRFEPILKAFTHKHDEKS